MEKVCQILTEAGKNLRKSSDCIHNGTRAVECPFDDFQKACNFILNEKENEAGIAGICFNISPYIFTNYQNIDKKIMWQILIRISTFIQDFPIAYGYLESVTELSIKSHEIDDEFLQFLINPEIELWPLLKPLLLVSLFDYLPNSFLLNYREYFLPLILNAFKIDDFLYRCNFLLIITEMELNISIIQSIPEFPDLIWNLALEAASSETNFSTFQVPFSILRKQIPEFFAAKHPAILEQKKDEASLRILVRLLPFLLDIEVFGQIFEFLHNFISDSQKVSKELNQAVDDSLEIQFDETAATFLFQLLSRNLMKDFDSASIYLFSLYYAIFEDLSKDSALMLINAINLSFASENPNLEILCFSIERIAEQYKARSHILQGSVLPALRKTFLINNNDAIVRYASKALIKLTETGTVHSSLYLNDYLCIFSSINLSDFSLFWIKRYFSVLKSIISLNELKSIELIFHFIEQHLFNTEFPLILKGFFLDLVTMIFVSDSDLSTHLAEIATSEEFNLIGIVIEFLQSDISYLYPIASEFLYKFDHYLQILDFQNESIHSMYERLLTISSGEVEHLEKKDMRETSYFTALFSSERDLPFPIGIIQKQLHDVDDEKSQIRALINLQYTYQHYTNNELKELLNYILILAKNSKSSGIVDSSFVFLKKLINDSHELSFEYASDLIYATIQSRIILLDHNFPFNYDNSSFKFYSCLSSYIHHFKDQSVHIICELLDWISFCDENILPKVIKCLNTSLEVGAIPSDLLPTMYHDLLKRLNDDSELMNYIFGCLVNLLTLFPGICDPNELLARMDEMWDPKDEDMIMILLPIYMDIWANIDVPINNERYMTFITHMKSEQFRYWNFRLNLRYLMTIVDHRHDLDIDDSFKAAEVLTHFLLKSDGYKEEMEFDEEFIEEMKESLKTCCQKDEKIPANLLNLYYRFPKLKNELAQIISEMCILF